MAAVIAAKRNLGPRPLTKRLSFKSQEAKDNRMALYGFMLIDAIGITALVVGLVNSSVQWISIGAVITFLFTVIVAWMLKTHRRKLRRRMSAVGPET